MNQLSQRTNNFTPNFTPLIKAHTAADDLQPTINGKRVCLEKYKRDVLQPLHEEFWRLQQQQSSCSREAAERDWVAAQEAYRKDPSPENFKRYKELGSRDEVIRHHGEISQVVSATLVENTDKRYFPACVPVLEDWLRILTEQRANIAASEKSNADFFDIPFIESETLVVLDMAIRQVKAKIEQKNGHGIQGPCSFLRGIVEFEPVTCS